MRFAISLLNCRPGRIGGAETYLRRLLEALARVAASDEVVVVAHREAAGIPTHGLEQVLVDRGDLQVVAARIAEAYTAWHDRALERVFERLHLDAAFFPQQSVFPKEVPVPIVLGAGDVQHLFFPEYFGLFDRTFRAAIYPYSLVRATRVLAVSEFTRRTLIDRCGVAAEKVATVLHGADPPPASPPRALEELSRRPYLYYPAATLPHKDHETLLRTYAALRRRGALEEALVFTGVRTRLWPGLERLVHELGIRGDVVHLGFIPFPDVPRVYAGATAVVFPTRFEGFGLPVVEAVALGKKVVTSRLAVFDEIGVPPEWQIDFADPDQLLAALRRPGNTSLLRTPQTWDDTARATLDHLRAVAQSRGVPVSTG